MEQPTENFSVQSLDWDGLEQRIYDRLIAKIKENPLLNGTKDDVVLTDGPSEVKVPDRLYPTEPISAMELYVRECILLERENGESFIDVKELRYQWRALGKDLQSGHLRRAIEINRNYLCLDIPLYSEPPFPSEGIVVEVPTLENAMERVFLNKKLQAEPKNFRELPEFVAKATDLKQLWLAMPANRRAEYTSEAKQLIVRWEKTIYPSTTLRKQELAPTTGYRLFKLDFCAQHDFANEKDVEGAWQSLPLVKTQAYRDQASKLNDAYISLDPPTDLQQAQMPTLASFHWRIFATDKLSKVCIQSNMFCEWLEKTRRDWLQMPTGQICTALALQEKWLAIARKNSVIIEQLTTAPTTAARLFEADRREHPLGCDLAVLDRAWLSLDRKEIQRYVDKAKRLNDDYVRLEPPATLKLDDVPSISTFQWRLCIDANHPPRGFINDNDFCVWIEQLRKRWLTLPSSSYYHEAVARRQKWFSAAKKSPAAATISELEDIDEALGPNVAKQAMAKVEQPKSVAVARVEQATAERNFKAVQSKALNLYTQHYRRDGSKRNLDMKPCHYAKAAKDAEVCWDKLSLIDRSPYIELAREAVAHREKRDAHFKNKTLPK